MAYFVLIREGPVFMGYKKGIPGTNPVEVFRVRGSYAARAAVRFFGIVTPIQDYFFDNPHGSHVYNVCDDPNDPYLGVGR